MLAGEARFRQRVDGVLLVDVMVREAGADSLASLDVPVVVLGEELHTVTSVSVDNVAGAAMAASPSTVVSVRCVRCSRCDSHRRRCSR